ncbi:TPA: NAD-binding protein, partial [Campylobacter coli]|nr:NAD-binding protein [Campylobacter coli]
IYRSLWKEAYERLDLTNPFPEFTGRVCPAPCEDSCVCAINGKSVSIKNNELAIIENAFKENLVSPNKPKQYNGKKIAVIGSGPAGLACANTLNSLGYKVSVFERSDKVGGLLMYGIPDMKLDKSIVDRRVDLLKESGIEFKVNEN